MTELEKGDRIEITGNPLMRGLNEGQKFTVKRIGENAGKDTYYLESDDGRKKTVQHYARDVDSWINAPDKERRYIKVIDDES